MCVDSPVSSCWATLISARSVIFGCLGSASYLPGRPPSLMSTRVRYGASASVHASAVEPGSPAGSQLAWLAPCPWTGPGGRCCCIGIGAWGITFGFCGCGAGVAAAGACTACGCIGCGAAGIASAAPAGAGGGACSGVGAGGVGCAACGCTGCGDAAALADCSAADAGDGACIGIGA